MLAFFFLFSCNQTHPNIILPFYGHLNAENVPQRVHNLFDALCTHHMNTLFRRLNRIEDLLLIQFVVAIITDEWPPPECIKVDDDDDDYAACMIALITTQNAFIFQQLAYRIQ